MRDSVNASAAAIEEQSVVTAEMSSNMQNAAQAVTGISHSITAISSAVAEVSVAVTKTKDAARGPRTLACREPRYPTKRRILHRISRYRQA